MLKDGIKLHITNEPTDALGAAVKPKIVVASAINYKNMILCQINLVKLGQIQNGIEKTRMEVESTKSLLHTTKKFDSVIYSLMPCQNYFFCRSSLGNSKNCRSRYPPSAKTFTPE